MVRGVRVQWFQRGSAMGSVMARSDKRHGKREGCTGTRTHTHAHVGGTDGRQKVTGPTSRGKDKKEVREKEGQMNQAGQG